MLENNEVQIDIEGVGEMLLQPYLVRSLRTDQDGIIKKDKSIEDRISGLEEALANLLTHKINKGELTCTEAVKIVNGDYFEVNN